jgi:hypothetical protein
MSVILKGFDTHRQKAVELLQKLDNRMFLESSNPSVWTKQQVDDLKLVTLAMFSLLNGLSEIANQVRDD